MSVCVCVLVVGGGSAAAGVSVCRAGRLEREQPSPPLFSPHTPPRRLSSLFSLAICASGTRGPSPHTAFPSQEGARAFHTLPDKTPPMRRSAPHASASGSYRDLTALATGDAFGAGPTSGLGGGGGGGGPGPGSSADPLAAGGPLAFSGGGGQGASRASLDSADTRRNR